jgi:RHS repeat-associated protein
LVAAKPRYDTVGNRQGNTNSIAQVLVTQPVATVAHDANNEQNQFGSTSNTFDANGNLISASASSGNTTTYTWDGRNRLASVSTSTGQTTRFTYDFAGNLIQQVDAGASLNLAQTLVLDNLTNVAYVNRSDGDQYSVLAGQSVDQHLAVVHANGQIEYGLADAINRTIATADQTGSIKGRFLYEPFGQTTAAGSVYPFQYTGRAPISDTLYYYRARFYSPISARFLSEDPTEVDDEDVNLYLYTMNSPVLFSDPLGQQAAGAGFAPSSFISLPALPSCNMVQSVPTIPELELKCKKGRLKAEPATGRRYKGCTSYQQEYICADGVYTVHWIDCNGNIVHGPHIRPGPPK